MKYLSLFSGIGGFEYGIQQSQKRMECVGFSEIDKYAKSIYKKHYPNHIDWGDVTKINTKKLPNFDFLVGGFPCQAFSLAGKRREFDDTRGTLFFEIARILHDKKPTYFLLENVKGLLSHDKGRTFQTILKVLSEEGYNVTWEVLNSKNFGVPQNRERIFIKGYFRTSCGSEVLSQQRACAEIDGKIDYYHFGDGQGYRILNTNGCSDTLSSTGGNSGGRKLIKLNNKSQAQTIYDSDGLACTLKSCGGGDGGKTGLYSINECISSTQKNATRTDGSFSPTLTSAMGCGGGHVPMIKCINKEAPHQTSKIYDDDGISPCLLAGNYKDPIKIQTATRKGYDEAYDGDGINIERPNDKTRRGRVQKDSVGTLNTSCNWGVNYNMCVRRLTPLECERLQAFPDNWTKYGVDDELISDTQRYKCIGNAVTTSVITYLVNCMFNKIME